MKLQQKYKQDASFGLISQSLKKNYFKKNVTLMRPIWSVHKAAITQERLYGALRWQKKSDMTNTARFLKVIERFQSLQRFFGHF